LEYWGFNDMFLESCCAINYFVEKDTCQNELEGEMENQKQCAQRLKEEDFGSSLIGQIRTYLWQLTEYPETSLDARVKYTFITFIGNGCTLTFMWAIISLWNGHSYNQIKYYHFRYLDLPPSQLFWFLQELSSSKQFQNM